MISYINKCLKIVFTLLIFAMPAYANKNFDCISNLIKYKQYLEKIIYNKAVIYNALNLSDSQREKFEQITQKNIPLYKQNLEELLKEGYKYKAQNQANFGFCEQTKQNIKIYKLKHKIYNISQQEDRDLLKILNRNQRSKYKNIKHLERHDLHKEYNPKDYYKSNPQIPIFGGKN